MRRCDAEQQHDLVQRPDFGAWRISAARPSVRFAFDKDWRSFATQVELVALLFSTSDEHAESWLKRDASFREEQLSGLLEFPACVSIANRTDALEILLHAQFPRVASEIIEGGSSVSIDLAGSNNLRTRPMIRCG